MAATNKTPDDLEGGNVPPPSDMLRPGERRILEAFDRLQIEVGKLASANESYNKDFRWTWTGLVGGFLLLAGLFIYGYNRLEDKYEEKTYSLTVSTTRIETKLDDLSSRIFDANGNIRKQGH